MEALEAVIALARTFPGIKVAPVLRNGDGRSLSCTAGDNCLVFTALPEGKRAFHGTVLVDEAQQPWHRQCKERAVGYAKGQ